MGFSFVFSECADRVAVGKRDGQRGVDREQELTDAARDRVLGVKMPRRDQVHSPLGRVGQVVVLQFARKIGVSACALCLGDVVCALKTFKATIRRL